MSFERWISNKTIAMKHNSRDFPKTLDNRKKQAQICDKNNFDKMNLQLIHQGQTIWYLLISPINKRSKYYRMIFVVARIDHND